MTDHRDYLKKEYENRLQRRPLYSKRAFARDLGISPSTLTDFFTNKLAFSAGRVALIGKKINLNEEQKKHWVDLLAFKFAKEKNKKSNLELIQVRIKSRIDSENNNLALEEFKTVSDWYHLAYLELISMDAKKYSQISQAAKALNIDIEIMTVAVQRLLSLGQLILRSKGLYQVNDQVTMINSEIPSMYVRQFHKQVLEKAIDALEKQTTEHRHNTSTFIALSEPQFKKIKQDLQTAALDIINRNTAGNSANDNDNAKSKLYCLSLQFFNLIHGDKK